MLSRARLFSCPNGSSLVTPGEEKYGHELENSSEFELGRTHFSSYPEIEQLGFATNSFNLWRGQEMLLTSRIPLWLNLQKVNLVHKPQSTVDILWILPNIRALMGEVFFVSPQL